jgi:hypothetical protein
MDLSIMGRYFSVFTIGITMLGNSTASFTEAPEL